MPNLKQITIDSRIFASVKEASKEFNIHECTLYRKIKKLQKTNLTLQEIRDKRTCQITILDKTFDSIAEAGRFLGHKKKDARAKRQLLNFKHLVRHGKTYTICRKNRPLTFEALFRIIDNIDRKVWCFDLLEKGFWEKPIFKNVSLTALRNYRHPVLTNLYHRDAAHRYSYFSETSPKTDNKQFLTLSEFFSSHRTELFEWHNAICLDWLHMQFTFLFGAKLDTVKRKRIWSSFEQNEYPLLLLEECLESMLKMTYSDFRRKSRNLSAEVSKSVYAHNQYMRFAEGKSWCELEKMR